jgi:hypothetical protein
MMRGKEMTSLVRSASFRTEVKDVLAMFGEVGGISNPGGAMNRLAIFIAVLVLSLFLHCHADEPATYTEEPTAIPGEPLEGLEASLDNGRDLLKSISLFDTGATDLEEVLIDEAFRREGTLGHKADGSADATLKKLRQCNSECAIGGDNNKATSCQGLISTSNIDAAFCAIEQANCKINCLSGVLETVQKIEIPDLDELEGERQIAILIVQLQELRKAANVTRQGVIGMESVALEELIRLNLNKYKEYGVPEGNTENTTAAQQLVQCTEVNLHQTGDCLEKAPATNPNVIVGFFEFWGNVAACEFVGIVRQSGCAAAATTRAARAAAGN